MPEAREEAPETAEKTEDVKNLTTSISKSSSESYSADAESLVAGSSLKAGDEHSFHNIMDEFLRMPDQGEHARERPAAAEDPGTVQRAGSAAPGNRRS